MSSIRKWMAVLLAILLVLSAVLALLLFNLERKAFAPATYQQAFANDKFYERLPEILARTLTEAVQSAQMPVSLRGLNEQIWNQLLSDLLPPETTREMGDQALASTLAYLNSESDTAQLSLEPLKERMAGEAGTQAVLNLMRTQPACTLEEMARIAMSALSQQEISLCNPPENLYPVVKPLIQGQLKLLSAAIPGEVTLAKAEPVAAGQADPRERIKLARLIMSLSPVVPLFILTLLTLVAVRGVRSWLVWWGAPALITGALGALTGWLAAPIAGFLLQNLLVASLHAYLPSDLLGNGSQLAAAIVDQFLAPVLFQGLILVIAGGLMLLLAIVLGRVTRPAFVSS